MNLNRMGNPLSRDERIKFNENLEVIEKELVRVGNAVPVSDDAKKIADEAKATAAAADSKSDNVQKQLTNIVVNGDSSPQAAQASVSADGTTYPSLKARLDAEQQAAAAQMADIVYNINSFWVEGMVNWTSAIQTALNTIPAGTTLMFNDAKYLISGNVQIPKGIKITGKKPFYDFVSGQIKGGTIIEGGLVTVVTGGDGTRINNIGVVNKSGDSFNVCFPVHDVVIEDVVADASLHGVLIQSNRGSCYDVIVRNSIAVNSIHGFVSKSTRVTLENLTAYDCTANGFVFVADNIPGSAMKADNYDNTAINCKAVNCKYGFNIYARDMFSTSNSANIRLSGLKLIGCTAAASGAVGFQIGEISMTNSAITYVKPNDIMLSNCIEYGTAAGGKSFVVKNAQNVQIVNMTVEKEYFVDYTDAVYVRIGNITSLASRAGNASDLETFALNSTAPSVRGGRAIYKTANTAITNIFNITEGKEDSPITIIIDDEFTTIQNTAYIKLRNTSGYSKKGSFVVLKRDNGIWVELYGNQVHKGTTNVLITDSGLLDLTQNNVFSLTGATGATTANKISVTGRMQQGELLTIIIRSGGGTLTFGGFDTMFAVPAGMPTAVTWNNALITQWTYLTATNKWVLVSKAENIPYA